MKATLTSLFLLLGCVLFAEPQLVYAPKGHEITDFTKPTGLQSMGRLGVRKLPAMQPAAASVLYMKARPGEVARDVVLAEDAGGIKTISAETVKFEMSGLPAELKFSRKDGKAFSDPVDAIVCPIVMECKVPEGAKDYGWGEYMIVVNGDPIKLNFCVLVGE